MRFDSPTAVMRRALELARRGLGSVEPNPMVGAVVVDDDLQLLGEGWHQKFGGPHAEVHALAAAGVASKGATLFVTLEPCCHFGKTPPCTQAVIAAGVKRVIVATQDPNPKVACRGLQELLAAGIAVEVGLLASEANALIAPFRKFTTAEKPWVIAKWAMTLDGKIATKTGDSRWISNEASRTVVHGLRGRVDAIVVGIGTALADDPLLTARPAGPRTALRIVVDSQCRLPVTAQLVKTVREIPTLIATSSTASADRIAALQVQGIEVVPLPTDAAGRVSLSVLCDELGRRRLTNVLVEGGAKLLGEFFDQKLVDEAYVFVAPKLIGGATAPSPLAGRGIDLMQQAQKLCHVEIQLLESDVLIHGRFGD